MLIFYIDQENIEVFSFCDEFDLKILSGSWIELDIKQKQVEALPLGESMKPETH